MYGAHVARFFERNTSYLLVLAYLLLDLPNMETRVTALGLGFPLILFLVLYALTAACLFLTSAIRNTPLRIFFALFFCASSIFLQTYERSLQQPLTYSAFLGLLQAHGDAGAASVQFRGILSQTVPSGLLLLLALILPPRFSHMPQWMPRWLPVAAPLAGITILIPVLFARGGEGTLALPAPFTPAAYGTLYLGTSLASETRAPVTVNRTAPPVTRDIVLIVDESISPLYLDTTARDGITTGLLNPPAGVHVSNFGIAAAITNCSAGANATLRHGGTSTNYRAMRSSGVDIWDYARRAGLRTVYLDGQRNHGELQNMMTPEERAKIDSFVQLNTTPIRDRDVTLAQVLADHLNNDTPEFIYMNKIGGHFPVHDRFPDQLAQYQPILPRGYYVHQSDGGMTKGSASSHFDGSPQAWQRYRNSYRNTLLWNVGEFFDRLFSRADLSSATLIYTSDHGQDLHERGNPGYGTHCGTKPVDEEGTVPLMIIEGASTPRHDWNAHLPSNYNRTSAHHIFPTLLALMDYDRADVTRYYGAALDTPIRTPYSFNITYDVLLGREPTWQAINIARLAAAPTSDYRGPSPAQFADGRPDHPGDAGR